MPRNASGVYSLPPAAGNPVVSATAIEPAWANQTLNDIATALTGSLPRDGSAPMTAPLMLLGDASVALAAVPKQQLDASLAAHLAAADPHSGYTTAAELAAYAQQLDATLTALAALNATAGLVEQTGADTFTKRPISVNIKSFLDAADAATARGTLGAGTVTGVTATAPVASSGGTAPVISMAAASAGTNGYMSAAYAAKLDDISNDFGSRGVGMIAYVNPNVAVADGATVGGGNVFIVGGPGSLGVGTWRNISGYTISLGTYGMVQRIA